MGKDLSEMSLEELWELFPIFLVAHDDRWKDSFNEIEQTLTGLLSDQPVVRISHIGSTAIQGIWAKNIVDVMVEIRFAECGYLIVLALFVDKTILSPLNSLVVFVHLLNRV